MKNFRTFYVAVEFYRQIQQLSLKGPLRDQLRRAASSIVLNLAEGRGKQTPKDQRRFFSIAMGSVRECQEILILEQMEESREWQILDRLAAHLYRLMERTE
jgi:four helix bundle protein